MADEVRRAVTGGRARGEPANGAALASFLAAGIGALATGVFVLLNEAGVVVAPTLYGPAGGVSGRTTFAVVVWLLAWSLLHGLWKGRTIAPGRACLATLLLIGLGILAIFPPVWGLL